MTPNLLCSETFEILIADDTPESLYLLFDLLESQGYVVRKATNGNLALASAQAVQPDLILLDIKMPDLSGYEVCQCLKGNPKTQHIPVIFISALHEAFDKMEAFRVGGVDYISKPFHLEEVLVRIQNQLALQSSLRRIQQLNLGLERRVQDRTAQLKMVNQTLQQRIIELREIENNLRESEEKFRQLSEHIQEVFWLTDCDPELGAPTTIRYISPAFETIWGQSQADLQCNPYVWMTTIHADDRHRVQEAITRQLIQGTYDEEYRVVRPDGTIRWIHDRGFPILNQEGVVYRAAGIAEDITDRKQAELERDRFFNLSLDLLFIANGEGAFKRLNPAWEETLGYTNSGLSTLAFWQLIHPDDRAIADVALCSLMQGQDVTAIEMRCRCQTGDYIWVAWNIVPFLEENLIYGAGRNISQQKQSEARLIHESLHDPLTGLANRACFIERVDLALRKNRRQPNSCFAVLFIDLDSFKSINDTLGHLFGDQLLIQIAHLLQESVRELDSVARLGGDEFTILLEEIQNPKEVLDIVERIQSKLKSAFHLGNYEVFTSASIGIVISHTGYQTVSDIIRDADIAMYRAKDKGKACYAIFNQEMYAQVIHAVDLENRLHYAISNQELQIFYQPIVSLQGKWHLEGFEVLLRWNHPHKGLIPASDFVAVAEDTGLINSIGEWVIQEACFQFSHWRLFSPSFENLYLSINVSGKQLREASLLKTLDQVLEVTRIPNHCLQLEITESSLIENKKTATQILRDIRQRGIHIILDDFGTGFSSLSYLHQFPIDTIKIDQSFIGIMHQGEKEYGLVRSIIMLAHSLNIATIAEGIETPSQLEQLQKLKCDSGQGFLFSQAMLYPELEVFLARFYNGYSGTLLQASAS